MGQKIGYGGTFSPNIFTQKAIYNISDVDYKNVSIFLLKLSYQRYNFRQTKKTCAEVWVCRPSPIQKFYLWRTPLDLCFPKINLLKNNQNSRRLLY
jgi:hypothetical protein